MGVKENVVSSKTTSKTRRKEVQGLMFLRPLYHSEASRYNSMFIGWHPFVNCEWEGY